MTPRNAEENEHVLMFIDITRAHPHCDMRREVWVDLPREDPRSVEEGVCAKLLKSLYGLRDAGLSFELFTRGVMEQLGFACGVWSQCVYHNAERNMQAYIYGDNFVIKGSWKNLYQFFEDLKVHMWAKNEGVLGPDVSQGDVREVVCLNRVFRWTRAQDAWKEAIEIEADARHVHLILQQLGLRLGSNAVVTPGVKPPSADVGVEPPREQHREFRSLCMRANYLAEDRPDIRFCTKEIARFMATPCELGWNMMKRLARYLAGTPRLVQRIERQTAVDYVLGMSDSDHAGCLRTRRSTS